MYLSHLRIENLRSLADVALELNRPQGPGRFPNVNVLLGDNGMGKTSVLRSAALAVLAPVMSDSSGFVPDALVRRDSGVVDPNRKAVVGASLILTPHEAEALPLAKSSPNSLAIQATIHSLGTRESMDFSARPAAARELLRAVQFDERSAAFFVVGYGAARRVESSARVDESARLKARSRRYERVSSLFEDHISLIPLSFWLPSFRKANPGRYTQVINLLNELLPGACQIQREPTETANGTEHLFVMNGVPLPFRSLSDGYRAYIGWIGDMLFHICMGTESGLKLRETRGLILVDEIDLHLHPEWQRTVVPQLSAALPQMQFIITTHSPIVVGSLESANLFLLTHQDGATTVQRLPDSVYGRSSEQILLSPYFGLASTRAPEVADRLADLAAKATRGDSSASLDYLRMLSKGRLVRVAGNAVKAVAKKSNQRAGITRPKTSAKPLAGASAAKPQATAAAKKKIAPKVRPTPRPGTSKKAASKPSSMKKRAFAKK